MEEIKDMRVTEYCNTAKKLIFPFQRWETEVHSVKQPGQVNEPEPEYKIENKKIRKQN